MKKRVLICGAVLLTVVCGVLLLWRGGRGYRLPFSAQEVSNAEICYFNALQKKTLTDPEDVARLTGALGGLVSEGGYQRIPTGGQSFDVFVTLDSGETWQCTYCQTAGDSGYYTDGTVWLAVSGLDLKAVWAELVSPAEEVPPGGMPEGLPLEPAG